MPPSLDHSHTEDTSAFLSLHWQLAHDLVPHRRGTLPAEADLVFAEQSLPLCCRRGTPPPPPWQPAGQPRPKPRSKPAIITIPSHCQHTDHPCYQPESALSGAGGFCHNQWVTDCDKVTGSKTKEPGQLLCKREKAAALPPSWSLLHLRLQNCSFLGPAAAAPLSTGCWQLLLRRALAQQILRSRSSGGGAQTRETAAEFHWALVAHRAG